MGLFRSRAVRPSGDGTYTVHLDEAERAVLAGLVEQLRSLLGSDDPVLTRLFPPAYGDDEERNQGYAVLAGAELIERRTASLDVVEASLGASELDEDQLESWMRSVNDLRLVLGTALGVDERHLRPSAGTPAEQIFEVYEYLGALLEDIVEALSSGRRGW